MTQSLSIDLPATVFHPLRKVLPGILLCIGITAAAEAVQAIEIFCSAAPGWRRW